MAKHTALQAILLESGFSLRVAYHVAASLDRLRLAGLGSDDVAAALLRWRSEAVEKRWHGFRSMSKWKIGLPDCPNLFGVVEEDGRERREG